MMSARIPARVVYPPEVRQWLDGGPEYIEGLFREHTSPYVRPDYLSRLEAQFRQLHEDIGRGVLNSQFSDVLFSYVYTYPALKRVLLVITYTRPCAEGFGFCRLLLLQLARSAYFYGYELQVDTPYPRIRDLLWRSFGRRALRTVMQEEYYPSSEGLSRDICVAKRYCIEHQELGAAVDALGCRDMLRTPSQWVYDYDYEYLPVLLNPYAFPTNNQLNRGEYDPPLKRIRVGS